MTSRSDMIPAIRPASSTGNAPILFSPSLRTASKTVVFVSTVSTLLPLSLSTDAMVMVFSRLARPYRLIVPLWAVKGKPHARSRSDPEPAYCDGAPLQADVQAARPPVHRDRG